MSSSSSSSSSQFYGSRPGCLFGVSYITSRVAVEVEGIGIDSVCAILNVEGRGHGDRGDCVFISRDSFLGVDFGSSVELGNTFF
jgi:hypothetical protein